MHQVSTAQIVNNVKAAVDMCQKAIIDNALMFLDMAEKDIAKPDTYGKSCIREKGEKTF